MGNVNLPYLNVMSSLPLDLNLLKHAYRDGGNIVGICKILTSCMLQEFHLFTRLEEAKVKCKVGSEGEVPRSWNIRRIFSKLSSMRLAYGISSGKNVCGTPRLKSETGLAQRLFFGFEF